MNGDIELRQWPKPRRAAPFLALALALHAAGLWGLRHASFQLQSNQPAIPVRILESPPPPPPPPPQIAQAEESAVEKPKEERPKLPPKTRIPKPTRRPTPVRTPAPHAPAATPVPQVPPAAVGSTEEAQPGGSSGGMPGGVAGGVRGGVPGGQLGGIVGGTGNRILKADEVAFPPRPVKRVVPEYPPLARARGIEGLVVLSAVVDRDGRIEKDGVAVVQSVPLLDQAAIEALKEWRFAPGRDRTGQAVRVLLEVPIRFRLR